MTVRTIDEIFRDFVTDGVPASGPFNPHKPDIRDTLKALTEGSENFPDNRVIRLNNANAGTANNIVVTASVAIPAAAYQVLYILNVTQENTGPVTVSGAINRDLVTNINQPIAPGYLIPGMALLCIDTGTELRLLSYGDAEAILAAAEDAAARAEAAAAGLNLPSAGAGDKGKALLVNSDATGYTLGFVEITVEARSDLKALPVFFKSARLTEAGREGTFLLKAGSPPVSDPREGIYVVSNTSGYYWSRIINEAARVFWFGAVANGATDDAPIVKDALLVVRDLLLPAKRPDGGLSDYRFASTVTLNNGNCLRGDSSRSKITISPLMAVDVFHYVGTQISVKDLLVYGNRTQTNFLHKFRTDLMNCSVIDIDNVWSDGCAGIFSDANSTFLLTNLTVTKCTNTGVTGRSLDFRDALAFIFFRRVAFDYVGVTNPSSNTYVVYMANNEGAIFEDVDVLGGTKVGFSDRDGFRFENCRAIWLTRCMADHMGGWGFFVSDCDYVYFTTCTSSLCNKDQYYINTNSRWVTATNCYAGGSNGETGAIAGVHGWLVENSIQVTVNGGTVSNCTGKGVVTSGATTRFVGTGIAMIDNAGGNYTLGSTMSHLVGCTKSDGTLTAYPTTNVSG